MIGSLRCLVALGHRQKVSSLLDPTVISQLQALKDHSGSQRISKLAEYFMGLIDGGPRPDRARKWAAINGELADQLLKSNAPAALAKDETGEVFPVKSSASPIVPDYIRKAAARRDVGENVAYVPDIGLLGNTGSKPKARETYSNASTRKFQTIENSAGQNLSFGTDAGKVPGYPLQPSYYQAQYMQYRHPSMDAVAVSPTREDSRNIRAQRPLRSALKKDASGMMSTSVAKEMNATTMEVRSPLRVAPRPDKRNAENQPGQTPKRVRFKTEYNPGKVLPAQPVSSQPRSCVGTETADAGSPADH